MDTISACDHAFSVTVWSSGTILCGQIDWTLQMSYLFNQAGVTGNTKVVVPYPTYLGNLSAIIQNLPARNR